MFDGKLSNLLLLTLRNLCGREQTEAGKMREEASFQCSLDKKPPVGHIATVGSKQQGDVGWESVCQ
jgi:hypothetical protein